MGSFKLGKMTIKSLFGKPETVRYPFEQKKLPAGMKGHIELEISKCTMCGICSKRCPSGTIMVNRMTDEWTIDPFDCIQCGACVRECPHDCLTMVGDYTKPSAEKLLRMYDQGEYRELKREELEQKRLVTQLREEAGAAARAAKEATTTEERAAAAKAAREAVRTAQQAKEASRTAHEQRQELKGEMVENDRPPRKPQR